MLITLPTRPTLHQVYPDPAQEPMYILDFQDGSTAVLGTLDECRHIHALLTALLTTGQHSGQREDTPEAHYIASVPGTLIVDQAAELSAHLGDALLPRRIRQALGRGEIPGAERLGRDWAIPRDAFVTWLRTRKRKPGRAPGSDLTAARQKNDQLETTIDRLELENATLENELAIQKNNQGYIAYWRGQAVAFAADLRAARAENARLKNEIMNINDPNRAPDGGHGT
jgi:hypothetical protein